MKIESLNHVALMVKNAEKTANFFERYCGMKVVHMRQDRDLCVEWIRHPDQKDGFMLVLIESVAELSPIGGTMDHLGFYVESRNDVDEIAAKAKAEGVLIEAPQYAGPVVGYYCMVQDPDGNSIEFSCEQMRV